MKKEAKEMTLRNKPIAIFFPGSCSLHLSSVEQCSEWKVENNLEARGRGINFPGLKFRDQTNLVHGLTLLLSV